MYHEVKEFELCHNLKTASIHFSWYKAYYQGDDSEKIDYTDSLDEDIPLTVYLKDGVSVLVFWFSKPVEKFSGDAVPDAVTIYQNRN